MDRRTALVAGGGVLMLVVLAAATSGGPIDIGHEPRLSSDPVPAPLTTTTRPPSATDRLLGNDSGELLPGIALGILKVLALLLLAAAVWVALRCLVGVWRVFRDRPSRQRHPEFIAFDDMPDVAEAVAADAKAQADALAQGPPRNGIVACWLRLEDLAAAAGMPRDPSETSAEFTARVIGAHTVRDGPLQRLAGLYREARFSAHTLTESSRAQAMAALRELHEDLVLITTEQPGDRAGDHDDPFPGGEPVDQVHGR